MTKPQTIKIIKTINAPLKYVYSWCTDFSDSDPSITGSLRQRLVVEKTKRRAVYVTLWNDEDDTKVASSYVTLKPPNSWHLEMFDRSRLEIGDYKLSKVGKSKTGLKIVFKNLWKDLSNAETTEGMTERLNAMWDKYVQALETEYKSHLQ